MERALFRPVKSKENSDDLTRKCHWILFALFLAQFVLAWLRLFPGLHLMESARWPEGLLLVFATATTIASQIRFLPGQNVILACVTIAFIASSMQVVGTLISVPFGPYVYTESFGPQLFHPLPWSVPCLWIVLILNSRGVARLILRPWRKLNTYGFWVIGIATFHLLLLELGFEPYATVIMHFWLWLPTKTSLTWYTAPWVNSLGWLVTSILIFAFATPSLISKKSARSPSDYHGLFVCLTMNIYLGTATALHHFWPAVILITVTSVVMTVFAVRGAKW